MESENLEDKKVCGQCIGDKLIAGEIRSDGERGQCSYCKNRRKCIAVLSLSERVDDVYREQYQPGEEEAYFYGDSDKPSFTTRGENPAEIIGDLLQCEPQIAEDIAKILGSKEAYDVHKDGATPMYDATSNYSVRPIRAYEFADRWSEFVDTVKHKSRFFLENGVGILDDLFEGIADLQHQGDRAPVRTIGKRSEERFIFRARRANSESERIDMCLHPANLLGPPPRAVAPAGRMNAAGISVMYGAFSAETCVSELRLAVAESAVSCKFEVIRPLRVLDLTVLHRLYREVSPFDRTYGSTQSRLTFFDRFQQAISKPVRPGNELEYLPTQVLAEYISTRYRPRIDAVIYASAQGTDHANNIVILTHAAIVKGGESQRAKPRYEEHRHEFSYSIWDTRGTRRKRQTPQKSFSFFDTPIKESTEAPYLRPVRESLAIHEVVGAQHDMTSETLQLPIIRERDLGF